MRLRFHPLFFLLLITVILLGWLRLFAVTILSLALHECGHGVVAVRRGYAAGEAVLLPFGLAIVFPEQFDRATEWRVALAGPLVSLSLALAAFVLLALRPSDAFLRLAFLVNLSLGVFNLLPAYPLDGSRVLLALSKSRFRALRILRVLGFVFGAAFLLLFVLLFFLGGVFNPTLALFALFLFIGAVQGVGREEVASVQKIIDKRGALA